MWCNHELCFLAAFLQGPDNRSRMRDGQEGRGAQEGCERGCLCEDKDAREGGKSARSDRRAGCVLVCGEDDGTGEIPLQIFREERAVRRDDVCSPVTSGGVKASLRIWVYGGTRSPGACLSVAFLRRSRTTGADVPAREAPVECPLRDARLAEGIAQNIVEAVDGRARRGSSRKEDAGLRGKERRRFREEREDVRGRFDTLSEAFRECRTQKALEESRGPEIERALQECEGGRWIAHGEHERRIIECADRARQGSGLAMADAPAVAGPSERN